MASARAVGLLSALLAVVAAVQVAADFSAFGTAASGFSSSSPATHFLSIEHSHRRKLATPGITDNKPLNESDAGTAFTCPPADPAKLISEYKHAYFNGRKTGRLNADKPSKPFYSVKFFLYVADTAFNKTATDHVRVYPIAANCIGCNGTLDQLVVKPTFESITPALPAGQKLWNGAGVKCARVVWGFCDQPVNYLGFEAVPKGDSYYLLWDVEGDPEKCIDKSGKVDVVFPPPSSKPTPPAAPPVAPTPTSATPTPATPTPASPKPAAPKPVAPTPATPAATPPSDTPAGGGDGGGEGEGEGDSGPDHDKRNFIIGMVCGLGSMFLLLLFCCIFLFLCARRRDDDDKSEKDKQETYETVAV